MARYVKPSFRRDHPGPFALLVFCVTVQLLLGLYWGYEYLSSRTASDPAGSTVPPAEAETLEPEEPAAPEERRTGAAAFWNWLRARGLKLWPVLLAALAIVEAADYLGRFFAFLKKRF